MAALYELDRSINDYVWAKGSVDGPAIFLRIGHPMISRRPASITYLLGSLTFLAALRGSEVADAQTGTATLDPMAIIQDKCSRCHDVSTITSARHTPGEWDDTLMRMSDRGAFLSSEEFKILRNYLITTYPKAMSP
jgi:hypothetical protein